MVAKAFLLVSFAASASGAVLRKSDSFLGNGMQPEVVARTLSKVEDEWKAQAAVYTECNSTTGLEGATIVNCEDAPSSFGKSCATVVTAIVQGSGGDKDVAKEYMADVCSQKHISGWHQQQCHALSDALRGAMIADKYENRMSFNTDKLCKSFWSHFLVEEQKRLVQEKAEREAAEKQAAEEAAQKEKEFQERLKQEAEHKAVQEAARKKQEAEAQAAEAKAKAAEAAAKAKQKKVEAEQVAQAAKIKMAEAEAAEKEHQKQAAKAAESSPKPQEKAVAAEAKPAPVKDAPKPAAKEEAKPAPAKEAPKPAPKEVAKPATAKPEPKAEKATAKVEAAPTKPAAKKAF